MIQKNGDLKNIHGLSERDRKMIEDAEAMLGPEPESMGSVKNMFWGNLRQDLLFPYPETSSEEKDRCDAILRNLKVFLGSVVIFAVTSGYGQDIESPDGQRGSPPRA